jgi:hypothetical protein
MSKEMRFACPTLTTIIRCKLVTHDCNGWHRSSCISDVFCHQCKRLTLPTLGITSLRIQNSHTAVNRAICSSELLCRTYSIHLALVKYFRSIHKHHNAVHYYLRWDTDLLQGCGRQVSTAYRLLPRLATQFRRLGTPNNDIRQARLPLRGTRSSWPRPL